LAIRYLNDPQTRKDDFYKDWGRGIVKISDIILEIAKARWG